MLSKSDKILILVESPTKVKIISGILKKAGYVNSTVLASIGHIATLTDGSGAYNSGIQPKNNFKMNFKVLEERKKVVYQIKNAAVNVAKIFIMTDPDREGEIIAWSLLKFCELPEDKCFRIITNEITSTAIIKALEQPVPLNLNLVNAGFVRIMSDKLIGYGLSPLGKKYIGARSIGRCQSIGLKIISERESEIIDFIPELYFNLFLYFKKENIEYKAKYIGYKEEFCNRLKRQVDVNGIISTCKNNNYYIHSIKKQTRLEEPKPAFCTASFQYAAASELGLKVKDAMYYAQKLFEGIKIDKECIGLITYMRTDSVKISENFLEELKTFTTNKYGIFRYPGKVEKKVSIQEGHEALRITNPNITPDLLAKYTKNQMLLKVYSLIWQRTIASVLPPAHIEEVQYIITNNGHNFILNSTNLKIPGYRIVYNNKNIDTNITMNFLENEKLTDTRLVIDKKFTQAPERYTEASLVKELQRKEIGRPSTYALTIETLLNPTKGYAILKDGYITPTDRGMQLAGYCTRSFSKIINLKYTKDMEKKLDLIATGKLDWLLYMNDFYRDLETTIANTNETGIPSDLKEKLCPVCGSAMLIKRSKFGKLFYGCSRYPSCRCTISVD